MPYELSQLSGLAALQGAAGIQVPYGCANFKPSNTRKLKRAKARVRGGVANANIAFIGDSQTRGAGSSPAMDPFKAFPGRLAERLTSEGLPANIHSIFGCGTTGLALPVDSRAVFGTGWTAVGNISVGNWIMGQTSPNTGIFAFTPVGSVDTFESFWYSQPGQGKYTINIDGGANTTIDSDGAVALGFTSITAALGAHTLNSARSTGGTIRNLGVRAYNSAVKQFNIMNWGWSGSKVADHKDVSSTFSPKNFYGAWTGSVLPALDVAFITLMINDANAPTNLTTYRADLAILVDTMLATGADVVLITGVPADPAAFSSQAVQRTYADAIYSLALEKNVPFIDLHAIFESYAVGQPLGYYADQIHHSDLANHLIGSTLMDVIRAI